jgi:4'-phosphopantetheinyl transferase
VWRASLGKATLDISLSYVATEGWIGLLRGGRIGVDVMEAERFAELEGVAQSFLNPEAAADIRGAADPALTFAAAWTEREARLKCLKRGLSEWTAGDAQAEAECACRRLVLGQRLVGAVCWLG